MSKKVKATVLFERGLGGFLPPSEVTDGELLDGVKELLEEIKKRGLDLNEVILIRELTAIRKLLAVIARLKTGGKSGDQWALEAIERIEKEADRSPSK